VAEEIDQKVNSYLAKEERERH